MEEHQVERIKFLREESRRLLLELEPANEIEWNAFDSIVKAHKMFRVIEYGKLGQLPLREDKPMEPVTCPTCGGTGYVVEEKPDADGSGATNMVTTDCPKCLGTGMIPAQAKLQDLSEAASPTFQAAMRDEGDKVAEGEGAPGQVSDLQADKAFEEMGAERDAANAADQAEKTEPIDLAKLHVKVGQAGERHLIHLNDTSMEGKQLRHTLVKLFQKVGIIEHADQLEAAIAAFPDSEGKKVAMAICTGTYTGQPHDEGDEQPD